MRYSKLLFAPLPVSIVPVGSIFSNTKSNKLCLFWHPIITAVKNVRLEILPSILSTKNIKGEWQDLHATIIRAPNHQQVEVSASGKCSKISQSITNEHLCIRKRGKKFYWDGLKHMPQYIEGVALTSIFRDFPFHLMTFSTMLLKVLIHIRWWGCVFAEKKKEFE